MIVDSNTSHWNHGLTSKTISVWFMQIEAVDLQIDIEQK